MLEFNATFLIAIFSFAVFIMIMNAIFYNPILGIIRKREDYISSNYEASKRYNASAKDFNDTRQAKLEQTQDKCRHEIRKAVTEAHNQANSEISAARRKTKDVLQQKKDELLAEGDNLKQTVKSTVVNELASSIVSKLLNSEVKIENVGYEHVNRVMD